MKRTIGTAVLVVAALVGINYYRQTNETDLSTWNQDSREHVAESMRNTSELPETLDVECAVDVVESHYDSPQDFYDDENADEGDKSPAFGESATEAADECR